ncbi:MAG: hypothetical protein KIT80_00975 [Chitinophagaceae bacterium]|nr:hypothetical protein [Chitinophagaceae bacterium]MCW5925463.1 hypothetical protein [Chitinophagaceae bacterium]
MNRNRKYLMSTGIATIAAILILTAVAYVSISVRAKERAGLKMSQQVEPIEQRIMKEVSPGMMDIPWKKLISFFK